MKNRKSQSLLMVNVYYLIFSIAVFLFLIYFIKDAVQKEDFKKQITAKQIALLLDASEPETTFNIKHANLTINKIKNSIEARTKLVFSYDFFNPYDINFVSEDGLTKIEVFGK